MNKRTMRWVAALFALILALGLAGCNGKQPGMNESTPSSGVSGEKQDPLEAFQTLVEEIPEVKSGKVSLDMVVKTELDGSMLAINLKGAVQFAGQKAGLSFAVNTLGESVQMDMYIADGWLYMQQTGQDMEPVRFKQAMPQIEDTETSEPEQTQLNLEKLVKDVTLEETDGNRVFRFTIAGEDIAGMLDELMQNESFGGMMSGMGEMIGIVEGMTFSTLEFAVTFGADNLPVKGECTFGMEMEQEGTTTTASLEMTVEMSDWNADFEVKEPEDLDSYTEMDLTGGINKEPTAVIIGSLFDESGNPVENFDAVYAALVEEYGKETVDGVLSLLSMAA